MAAAAGVAAAAAAKGGTVGLGCMYQLFGSNANGTGGCFVNECVAVAAVKCGCVWCLTGVPVFDK
jgi:hypothetical protein